MRLDTVATFYYNTQDFIFKDTTYQNTEGSTLTINLGIDDTVITNIYKWYKNNVFIDSIKGNNKRIFNSLRLTDAGVWTCRVTNPNAPLLTLQSRNATIRVLQDTTTCRYKDSLALIAFYDATGGPTWRKKTNWKSNRPLNEWYGIYTNTEGCVTGIDLDGTSNNTWSIDSMGNNLRGQLPNEIGTMSKLELLILNGNTGLAGVLPSNFGNMTALSSFWAYGCRFTAPFPNSFWTMANVDEIDLTNNPLNTTPPSGFSLMPKLSALVLPNSGLYGTVPDSWSGKLWRRVQLEDNKIDSLPNLSSISNAPNCNCNDSILNVKNNYLTFDDILPTLATWQQRVPITYTPQDSIFQNITYTQNVGDNLSINLGIDGALTTNKYVWIKNGVRVDSSNQNTKILRGLLPCDAGTYRCEVTNTAAPLLTLTSRIIKIIVNGTTPTRLLDTTICFGTTYRLPSGRVVATAGNYMDTLRNVRKCDSLISTTRLSVSPFVSTITQNTILCNGKTYTLPNGQVVSSNLTFRDTIRNQNGCDSFRRVFIFTTDNNATTVNLNPVICRGQNYTLPNAQIVAPTVTTTYRDTLKNRNGCDSLWRVTKITVNLPTERPLSISLCSGQKHTLPKGVIVSKSGIYRDTFRTSNGCDSSIVTTVTVTPPIITQRNKTILEGQKDTLPKGRVVTTEGVYQDTFRTANGCDSIVVTTLTVKKIVIDETCFDALKKNLPDAFSPNGDGVNELFDPEKYFLLSGCPFSLRAEQLIIVSRWGEVIYKAHPYQAWDGTSSTYKNTVMPSAYYYVLVFKIDGKERLVKGVINCFSR